MVDSENYSHRYPGRKALRLEHGEPKPVSDLMQLFIKSNHLESGMCRNLIFNAWDAVSGAESYTLNKYLKDNVLHVTISSSVLRSRLTYDKSRIVGQINEILASDELLSRYAVRYRLESISLH